MAGRGAGRHGVALAIVVLLVGGLVTALTFPAGATTRTISWGSVTDPDPFRGYANDVDCVSASWCMTVDGSGQAVRYHGGIWDRPVRVYKPRPINGLFDVSCASTSLCFAAGGDGLIARWNGAKWSTPAALVAGDEIQNISCTKTAFCMVLTRHKVAIWNGSVWRITGNPMPVSRRWTGLSCTSAGFCMSTFQYGTNGYAYAWSYKHHVWHRSVRLWRFTGDYVNLSCVSHLFCMAVGDPFSYMRWDGARWRAGSVGVATTAIPSTISCSTSRHCVMAGPTAAGSTSTEWNGTAWTNLRTFETRPSDGVQALSCAGTRPTCLAVDVDGGFTWYSDRAWHRRTNHDPGWGGLVDISCGTTMCLAGDTPGGFVRTSGAGWSTPRRAYSGNFGDRRGSGLSCVSDTFCLRLAANGNARRYDGTTWHGAPSVALTAAVVSCISPTWCAALDPWQARWSVYNGSSWTKPVRAFAPTTAAPWDLSCGNRSLCIATSWQGGARVFNGRTWSATKLLNSSSGYRALASCAGSFCMAVAGTAAWRYRGGWHSAPRLSRYADAITCTSSTFCAVLDTDQIDVFNGTSWTTSTTLPQVTDDYGFDRIDCTATRLCVVAGYDRAMVGAT